MVDRSQTSYLGLGHLGLDISNLIFSSAVDYRFLNSNLLYLIRCGRHLEDNGQTGISQQEIKLDATVEDLSPMKDQ